MSFYYTLNEKKPEDKRIAQRLLLLKEGLKRNGVPQRTLTETLLLATWNIREFDSKKYGNRSKESIFYIAEIISAFDIVAVQEVRYDLSALHGVMKILGGWWKYVVTDVTEGKRGNEERMAFIYDSRKLRFGGLAGEIVIPPIEDNRGRTIAPSNQLYRSPYIVGFNAGWFEFMICTAHVLYGKGVAENDQRREEIEQLANFLAERANQEHAWCSNLILLGDFNIFKPSNSTFKAIIDAGFKVPEKLQSLPSNASKNKHYDQIAFLFADIEDKLETFDAGVFNFYNYVFKTEDRDYYIPAMGERYNTKSDDAPRSETSKARYYKTNWRTYQMSDHLPMWIELKIDFGNDYLQNIAK